MTPQKALVLSLRAPEAALAQRIAAQLEAEHWSLEEHSEKGAFAKALAQGFDAGRALVVIASTGAVMRILAPKLADKYAEPPVVCLSPDGQAVVPLLGGHQGANTLAKQVAGVTGGQAAITTASETLFGLSLEEPPAGWRWVNPPPDLRGFLLALNRTRAVDLTPGCPWLDQSALPHDPNADLRIHVGLHKPQRLDECNLWLVPQVLALGMGCERFCDKEHLRELLDQTLEAHGLPQEAIFGLFSLDLKATERGLQALARELGVPFRTMPAAKLEDQLPRLTAPSEVVFKEVGCHGVAEGAALTAAGPLSELVVPKQKTKRATIAIAKKTEDEPQMTQLAGTATGSLLILGLGPGDPGWRAAAAEAELAQCDELVGYGYYIDQLEPLASGQTRHDFALGEEEKRCEYALDLAASGKRVALICSGDPGVFAMAAPLFELMDRHLAGDKPQWGRIDIKVLPGITAMMAASAKLGAPLGHDFCAISLSDLLTPREAILKRLKAASEGDFVVAFYNPVSRRRRELLDVARDELLKNRPDDTPVVICRQVGRAEEHFNHTTLAQLRTDDVDMFSLVMVGSSHTRLTPPDANGHRWLYTPRGYANKASD